MSDVVLKNDSLCILIQFGTVRLSSASALSDAWVTWLFWKIPGSDPVTVSVSGNGIVDEDILNVNDPKCRSDVVGVFDAKTQFGGMGGTIWKLVSSQGGVFEIVVEFVSHIMSGDGQVVIEDISGFIADFEVIPI